MQSAVVADKDPVRARQMGSVVQFLNLKKKNPMANLVVQY